MSAETVLLSLLSAIVGGLIVAVANHRMTQRREADKKATDIRIEYLIDCWTKIERAANIGNSPSKEKLEKSYDELEQAIAKVIPLGDPSEVEAAKLFAHDLAAGSDPSTDKLLNSLRDGLREKLELPKAGALDLFFRMHRH